jgi:hypothetical protein
MREFGIDDLYLAICQKPNVFLVGHPSREWNADLAQYLALHYGIRPQFGRILEYRGDPRRGDPPVTVFRVSVEPPGPPGKTSGG